MNIENGANRFHGNMMTQLKMMVMDKEDLAIVSTYCQDAVLKIGDLDYQQNECRFVLVMNRFVWENEKGTKNNERRRSVLHFDRVEDVKAYAIDRAKRDDVLSLLAVTFEPTETPAGFIHLVFSGNATIKLSVECIEAQLADLAGAWEASSRPVHRAAD